MRPSLLVRRMASGCPAPLALHGRKLTRRVVVKPNVPEGRCHLDRQEIAEACLLDAWADFQDSRAMNSGTPVAYLPYWPGVI